MQTIAVELPSVRQMEAISFRSMPATYSYFNGSWAVRLTDNHPAKRLNSITPLDPGDHGDIEHRIKLEQLRFNELNRQFTMRITPLAPPELVRYIDKMNWQTLDSTSVMTLDLEHMDIPHTEPHQPDEDIEEWVSHFTAMQGRYEHFKPGMVELLQKIQAPLGLFLNRDQNNNAQCATRMVINNKLVGIFDLVTKEEFQRQGLAKTIMYRALDWAKRNGAKQAWLQVVSDNRPAMALYESMGFVEFYRYNYRRPSEPGS